MITRFLPGVLFLSLLVLLSGCDGTTIVVVAPTATPTNASAATATVPPATATATIPPATATPAPGVCNAADFASKIQGGPDPSFQYPPLTYHGIEDAAAGTYFFQVCSSGTPSSILAFLTHAIPAGGWTITANTATTLNAVQTNHPQSGLCASVNLTVGSHAGFPGEWDAYFHSPTSSCTP